MPSGPARPRVRKPAVPGALPSLIAASGLRIRRVEPVRPVALAADVVLVAAERPC